MKNILTIKISLLVLIVIFQFPGFITNGEGVFPFSPDTVVNCGVDVGLKRTENLK